jgi:F0F1-type ATP synthase assembly protein I
MARAAPVVMKGPTPLRILVVWSLIPTYMLAGGAIGYGLDRWLKIFPLFTAVGLLVAFGFAIRDMLKLRKELEK